MAFHPGFLFMGGHVFEQVPNRWKGSACIPLLGQRFCSLLYQTWGRKHVTLVTAADPLANAKGDYLTTKLKIGRGQWQQNRRKHYSGPSCILPGALSTSGLWLVWANTSPLCLSPRGLTFLLFAAESILIKTTALWGRNCNILFLA